MSIYNSIKSRLALGLVWQACMWKVTGSNATQVKNVVTPCKCKYFTDLCCCSWINDVKLKFKLQNSACLPYCLTFYNYLETVHIFKVYYHTTTLPQICKVHTTAQPVVCQIPLVQPQVQSQGRQCEICDRRKWKWGKYLLKNLKAFPWQLLFYARQWPAQSEQLYLTSFPQLRLRVILTFWRWTFFQILAHPVFKMWVIQKPNKVALWNKRHFEEKKNGDYTACLKYSVRIFVE
jgi:hypothetical protein